MGVEVQEVGRETSRQHVKSSRRALKNFARMFTSSLCFIGRSMLRPYGVWAHLRPKNL